ncbi:hypothetical protein PSP31120_01893 [Pandoraea sputorum]|nr:hypothetical protein PSP31120_01893 [Pandoraea sputorum]
MDAALDTWTRKLVSASSARKVLFGAFICPRCYEPVHLRAGSVRAAHFAHNHGVAREECELYVQSIYRATAAHASQADHIGGRPGELQLGLRLYLTARPMSWGLELALGVKDVSEGHVLIDVGGRETAVDLTGNQLTNYTVVVEPQQAPYRVLSVSPPLSQATIFEDANCEGLRRVGMTAFTAVGRAGHALFPRADKIDGGRTYAVVWRNENPVPFPTDWEWEALEPRENFSAALVFIPKLLSQESEAWIRANLELPTAQKIQNIVQIWPPISNRITSQSIQSVRDDAIIVALDEIDVRQPTNVFVRCDGDVRAAGGIPGVKTFFRYEPAGKPMACFVTSTGAGAMLDVEFSLPTSTPWHSLNAAVVLQLTSDEGGSTTTPLHSRHATQALMSIRQGFAKLDCISLPRGAQGRLVIGLGHGVDVYRICATNTSVSGTKGGFQLSNEDAALFVDVVCKREVNVVIDFGAFGYVSLPAISDASLRQSIGESVELPEQVRALLKNYLFRFGSVPGWPRPDVRMSDSQLVSLFNSNRGMTGGAATRRYLKRELARYVDGVT